MIEVHEGMRTCSDCGQVKPHTDFDRKTIRDGRVYRAKFCRPCRNVRRRAEYDPEYNTNAMMKKNYGITLEEYDAMVEKQDGKCAICETTKPKGNGARFHIDHSHKTGKVRGLLCSPCNLALGKFKDDIAILQSAIEYLRDHANG